MRIKISNYLNWQKIKFLIIILAFLLLYFLENKLGIKYLILLPGIILTFYLPGFSANNILGILNNHQSKFFDFFLNIFTSIILVVVSQYFLINHFALNQYQQILFIFYLNLFFWFLYLIFGHKEKSKPVGKKFTKFDWLIFLIPFILFGITLLIDPFVENSDNYLTSIQNSILLGANIRSAYREFYIPFVALLHFISDVSLVWVYKVFISWLFYLSLGFLFDFIKNNIKNNKLGYLSYLLVIGASVIITEINIVRPQVLLLAFILPILFLNFYTLEQKNFKFGLLALFLSLGISGFHAIGLILVLISLISLTIISYQIVFIDKVFKINAKIIIKWLAIIFPYYYIIQPFRIISSFSPTIKLLVEHLRTDFHWQWWFLDNYKTIDGFQLGWKGIWAVNYYLYSGILLLILVILLGIIFKKQLKKTLPLLPVIIFSIIFFAFAEIMPRLGYFFFPNRAWSFLMLSLIILICGIFAQIKFDSKRSFNLAIVYLALVIFSGVAATLYLTKNTIGEIRWGEMAAIKFVSKEIPPQSIILSSQDNEDLFTYYSNKTIARVKWDKKPIKVDKKALYRTVLNFNDIKYFHPIKLFIPEIKQHITTIKDGKITEDKELILQSKKQVLLAQSFISDASRYFFYSLIKNQGMATLRDYKNQNYNDTINNSFFKNYSGPDVIYNDGKVIIIKIK